MILKGLPKKVPYAFCVVDPSFAELSLIRSFVYNAELSLIRSFV